ncbi:hypothetical protein MED222_05395 [Vibrio sp. MED222]|nr:hypothetical protein MED222_05395 [Vibrio sp. MED222]
MAVTRFFVFTFRCGIRLLKQY